MHPSFFGQTFLVPIGSTVQYTVYFSQDIWQIYVWLKTFYLLFTMFEEKKLKTLPQNDELLTKW